MCGIVGIYSLKKRAAIAINKKRFRHMVDIMEHRGPDDSGIFLDKNIALGHRRLSIIDLSKKGHQPMLNDDKSLLISYNGEIYNFEKIRDELKNKGYSFNSKCDTEVIIKAYEEYSINCLDRFNGMFAFAIYDKKKDELFLARDRLGIKPLYYYIDDNKLIFASEIKAILEYPGFSRQPNLRAISSYLSYRYVLGEETLFKGIKQLLPGHYLRVQDGHVEVKQYWDIPLPDKKKDLGEKYYVMKVRELLKKAVKQRMISDVPIGAYLSGGLDSSVIVSIMEGLGKKHLKTYSIGFEEEGFDEFEFSSLMAKKYEIMHKKIIVSPEKYIGTIKKLIWYKDLPLSVPNEVPLYLMSKELKKDITVVLSGEGADEIFYGYGRIFRSPFDYNRLKVLDKLPLIKRIFFNDLTKKYRNKRFKNELEHFLHNYSYFPLAEKKRIFNKEMNDLINNDRHLIGIFEKQYVKTKTNKLSYYDKISYLFEKLHLPGLLARVDMTTMATSVEARVPFVDHELVEFMFTVPLRYKLRWNSFSQFLKGLFLSSDKISENLDTPKYVLRKAFNNLPKEILKRKKKGFPVPLDSWFKKRFINYSRKMLLSEESRVKAFVDQDALDKWIVNCVKNKKDDTFGQKLWMLLNLELWMREYF